MCRKCTRKARDGSLYCGRHQKKSEYLHLLNTVSDPSVLPLFQRGGRYSRQNIESCRMFKRISRDRGDGWDVVDGMGPSMGPDMEDHMSRGTANRGESDSDEGSSQDHSPNAPGYMSFSAGAGQNQKDMFRRQPSPSPNVPAREMQAPLTMSMTLNIRPQLNANSVVPDGVNANPRSHKKKQPQQQQQQQHGGDDGSDGEDMHNGHGKHHSRLGAAATREAESKGFTVLLPKQPKQGAVQQDDDF